MNNKVLISGAGVGGLTLAYFLSKNGYEPVIVEKASSLRHNGYMIDFFSSGIYVSEKMGIMEELKNRDHKVKTLRQHNKNAKKDFSLDISVFKDSMDGKLFNFLRTDLVDILYQKVKPMVEIRFSTSINTIVETNNNVVVTFEDGAQEEFALLFGADGIHSNVRQLLYSPNEIENVYLGYYVAALEHKVAEASENNELFSMLAPKRQIMTYEVRKGVYNSLLAFKSPLWPHISMEEKERILRENFADFKGATPKIIDEVKKQDNLYFDEVSQIRLHTSWHKGRVVLLGDAAYCITLLSGQGASMAMTGAYLLAQKLQKFNGNYEDAFTEYEADLRPTISKMQKKAVKNAATYLPSTKFMLWIRNLFAPLFFTKLFAPLLVKQIGAQNFFNKKK